MQLRHPQVAKIIRECEFELNATLDEIPIRVVMNFGFGGDTSPSARMVD